jgi:protease PrsW
MAYCTQCGAQMAEGAAFCSGCGASVNKSAQSKSAKSAGSSSSIQSVSDSITGKLGLDKIDGFSLSKFFSEVFRKHEPDEVERLIAVGTPETTPVPDASMGVMPNPWIFFRVLCGTVIAYIIFVVAWNSYQNLNLVPGLIILGSLAVPFSILILFLELNTPKNISIVKIIKLLMIGGALSLFVTLILFSKWEFLVTTFGASSAGIIEEIAKLAALLFVMRKVDNTRYKYRLNALLLGAAVGAGFAAFESAGYAFRFGLQYGPQAMLDIILLRGVLAPFMHIAWTAIAASAYWIARQHHNTVFETLTSTQFLKLFAIPVVLHFVWNYNLPFQMNLYVKAAILGFIAWVVILSLVQSGLREMAELTAPKEAGEIVT